MKRRDGGEFCLSAGVGSQDRREGLACIYDARVYIYMRARFFFTVHG